MAQIGPPLGEGEHADDRFTGVAYDDSQDAAMMEGAGREEAHYNEDRGYISSRESPLDQSRKLL